MVIAERRVATRNTKEMKQHKWCVSCFSFPPFSWQPTNNVYVYIYVCVGGGGGQCCRIRSENYASPEMWRGTRVKMKFGTSRESWPTETTVEAPFVASQMSASSLVFGKRGDRVSDVQFASTTATTTRFQTERGVARPRARFPPRGNRLARRPVPPVNRKTVSPENWHFSRLRQVELRNQSPPRANRGWRRCRATGCRCRVRWNFDTVSACMSRVRLCACASHFAPPFIVTAFAVQGGCDTTHVGGWTRYVYVLRNDGRVRVRCAHLRKARLRGVTWRNVPERVTGWRCRWIRT